MKERRISLKREHVMIFVACPSKSAARTIGDALLKKRIVACAQTTPGVTSRFWWKGRIDTARESLLTVKTTRRLFHSAASLIRRLHPYEVPEIIAVPIVEGDPSYLKWIEENVALRRSGASRP